MNKKLWAGLVLVASLFGANVANAAMLQVSADGKLTGATGVDVNGTLYDVSFQEGSCDSLFGGCDPANFAFHNASNAFTAAWALLQQVFIDSPLGYFDFAPDLLFGCSAVVVCGVLTPYDPGLVMSADNGWLEFFDRLHMLAFDPAISTAPGLYEDSSVYAIWTVTETQLVPEPSILSLLGAGIAAATFRRRRK